MGALAALAAGGGSALAATPPASSWQTNGIVRAITFSGGVMYVGGQFTSVRPPGTPAGAGFDVPRQNVAAFSESTGKPLSWNPGANGIVYSIAVRGPAVYMGGRFSSVAGHPRANMAAVAAGSGALLPWSPGANSTATSSPSAPTATCSQAASSPAWPASCGGTWPR